MVFLFLFILNSWAGVIQDDVTVTDKVSFSFKTVCDRMVTHESPLIDAASGTEIDCMGKKVNVAEFCDKEMAQDPYYLRGYVDSTSKQVVCKSGKKVIFKYMCVKFADRALCSKEAKSACEEIKLKLARRLDIVHSSFVKTEKGIKQLNCFYESLPLKESRGAL